MTTYIESLKLNIPTIIFLDKKYPNGLISKSMSEDFQKLEDVGILYFSPKSAANAINRLTIDEKMKAAELAKKTPDKKKK